MTSIEILNLVKNFKWNNLNRVYGCAHSSIIGFITYEWLDNSLENSVLDGAPSPVIGNGGRTGQKNSDLLLCKNSKPFIPVEVETQVKKYDSKLDSLIDYKNNFDSIEFCLFYLSNLTNGEKKYKHCWDSLKEKIIEKNYPFALLSAEKQKINFESQTKWSDLLKRNDYSQWEIVNIDCWIFDINKDIIDENIWRK
jgi:hypothetical protein